MFLSPAKLTLNKLTSSKLISDKLTSNKIIPNIFNLHKNPDCIIFI